MEKDYLTEVSSYFLKKKGQGIFLAPKDIMLIQDWHSDGIPLSVTLLGIKQAFKKIDSTDSFTNLEGAFICDKHIRDAWEHHNSSTESMQIDAISFDEGEFFIFEQALSFFHKKLTNAKEEGTIYMIKAFEKISEKLINNKQVFINGDFFNVENEADLKKEIEYIALQELFECMPDKEKNEIKGEVERALDSSDDLISEKGFNVTKYYFMKNKIFSYFSLPKSTFWFI